MSQTATAYCGVPRPTSSRDTMFLQSDTSGNLALHEAERAVLPHKDLPPVSSFRVLSSSMPFSQSTVPQASFCSFQSTTTTDCNTGPASRASLDCVLPLLTQSSSLLLPPAWLAADGSAFPLLASSRAAANRSPAFLQAFGERTAGDPRVEEISEETEHEGEQPATGGTASGDGPAGLRREKVASLRGIDDACRGAGILPSQGQRSQGRESREACGEGDRQQTWRLREGERDCGTQSSLSLVSRASTSSLPPRKLRSPLIPASASSLSAHRMPVPWTAVRQAYPHVQVDPRKHAVSAYSFSSLSPKSFSPPRTPRALLNCMRQTNAPFPEPSKAAKPHRVGSRRRIGTRLTSRLLSPAEVSRQLLEQYPGPPAEAVPGEPDAENRATGVSGFFPEGKSRTEPVLPSSKGDSEKHLLHGRTTLSLASTRATRLSSSSSRLLSRLTLASLSTGKRPDSEQRRVSGIPPVRSRSDSQASGGHTPGQPPSSAPRAAYTHSPAFSRLLSRAPSLKRHSSCPRNAEATEAPVAVQPPVGERERRTLPVLSKRRVSTASRVSGVKRRDLGAPQKRDREEEGPLAGLWRLLAFPSEEGGPEVSEAESETSDTSADVEAVDAWGAALDRVDTGDPWRPHPAPPASYGTLKSLPPKSLPPKPLSSKSLSVTSLAEMREKGVVLEAAQPLRGSSKRGPVSRGSEAVHAGRSREEARKERSASLHARPCGDCDTLPGPCFGDAERDRKGTSSVKEKQPPFSEPGGAPEPQAALQSFESEDERCLQSTCSSLPKPMRVPPLQLSIEKRSPRLCSPSHSPPAPPGSTTLVLDSGLLRHAEETEGRPRVAPMSPARDGPPHRGPQQQRGGSVFSRSRESLLSLEEESRQSDDGAALGEDEAAPKETERGETEGRERERSPAERRIHSAFLSKEETTGTSSTLSSFLGVKPANAERGSSACSILVGALEGRRRRLASPRDFPPPTFERILFGLPCEGDKDGTGGDTAAEEEEEEEAREEEEGGEEGEERAEVEEPREQVRGEDEQRGPREQKRTEERRSGSVPSGEMRSADVREERRRRRRDHKRALVAREVKELKEEPAADVGSTVAQGLSLLPSFFSAMLARGEDTTAPQTAWDVESEVGETPREERVQARSLKRELASPAKRGLSRSASLEATSMRKKLLSLVQSHSDVSKAKQRRPMNLRHLRDLPSLASLSPKEKFRDLIVERPRQRRAPPKRKTAGTSARDFLEESASDGNLNRYRSLSSFFSFWRGPQREDSRFSVSSQARRRRTGGALMRGHGGASAQRSLRRRNSRGFCSLSHEERECSRDRLWRRESERRRTDRHRARETHEPARRLHNFPEDGLARAESMPSRVAFRCTSTRRELRGGVAASALSPDGSRVRRQRNCGWREPSSGDRFEQPFEEPVGKGEEEASVREARAAWLQELRARRRERRGQEMAFGPLMRRPQRLQASVRHLGVCTADFEDARDVPRGCDRRQLPCTDDSLPASPRETFLTVRRRLRPPFKYRREDAARERCCLRAESFSSSRPRASPRGNSLLSPSSPCLSSSVCLSEFEEGQPQGRDFERDRRDTQDRGEGRERRGGRERRMTRVLRERESSPSSDFLPPHTLYIPPLRLISEHAKGLPEGCRLDSLRLPDSIRSAVPRGRFAACSDEEDEGARSVRTDRDLLTSLFELPFASSPARRRLQQVIRRHALFKLYDEDESEPSEARLPEASQPDACGLSAPPGKTKKRDIPRALLEQLEAPKTPVRHTPRIPSLSPSLSAPSSRSSVSSASSRSSVSSASSRSSVSSASAFSPLPSCARSKRKDEEEQKPERNGTEWRDDLGKEKRRRGPHREATKTRRVSDASPAFSPARRRSGEQRRERRAREKSRETEGWNRRARAPQKPIENVLRRQNERVHAPKKAPRSPVGGKTSEVRDSAATEREETGERQTALGRQGRPRKTQRGDRETSKEVNVKTTKGSHERYRDMESPTLRQSRRNVSSSSSPSSISSVSSSSAAASLRGRLKKDTARRRERHRGKDKRRQLSASSVSSAACSSSSTSHERRRTHSHEKRERSKKSERGSTRREQELKQGPQLLEPEFTTEAELVAVVRRLLDQVTKRKHSEADSPSVAPLQPLSNLHAVRAALLRRQQDLEAERRELTASCLEDGDQCGETGLRDTHRDRGDAHRGRRDPRGDRGGDRGSSREQSPRETARLVGAKTSQTGLLFVTLKAPESEKTSEKGGRGDGEDGFRSVGKKAALPHLPFAATRLREVARKAAEWRGGRSVSDFSCDSSSSDEDIPSAFNMVWQ